MTNLPRFSLTMPEDLLDVIDEYQIAGKFSTRSKAIQHLITKGLNDYIMHTMNVSEAQAELINITNSMSESDVKALVEIAKRIK